MVRRRVTFDAVIPRTIYPATIIIKRKGTLNNITENQIIRQTDTETVGQVHGRDRCVGRTKIINLINDAHSNAFVSGREERERR